MDRRKKIILIIAAVLAVIGVIVLLLRPKRVVEAPASSAVGSLSSAPTGTLVGSGGIVNAPASEGALAPPLAPPSASVAVQSTAMTFAERYGSFSSEGNFVNVEDLYPLMTERYQRRSEAEVARQRAAGAAAGFQSTTTIVVSATVTLPNGEESKAATARVVTQRTSVRGGERPRTFGQEISVQLLKVGEEWRVDGADWGPELES